MGVLRNRSTQRYKKYKDLGMLNLTNKLGKGITKFENSLLFSIVELDEGITALSKQNERASLPKGIIPHCRGGTE